MQKHKRQGVTQFFAFPTWHGHAQILLEMDMMEGAREVVSEGEEQTHGGGGDPQNHIVNGFDEFSDEGLRVGVDFMNQGSEGMRRPGREGLVFFAVVLRFFWGRGRGRGR
jgi:hypothetical protein